VKINLYDKEQESNIEVDEAQLPELLKSDRFVVPRGTSFEFEDDSGQRRIVPSEQIFEAIDAGFKIIPSEQVKKESDLKEAGESPFEAAGVSLASGLTLGISDQILQKTGAYTEEELSNLSEANPIISTIGEIGGAIAPALFSGGSSIAASIAAKTPAALAIRAGEKAAVSAFTGKVLSKTTSDVAKKAIEMGVGSAVEGSLFGAGQLLKEEALGNAEFNGENLVSYMGMGALTGGAVGFGVSALSSSASNVFKKGRDKILELEKKYIKGADKDISEGVINKIEKEQGLDDYAEKRGISTEDLQSKYDDDLEFERSQKLKEASDALGVPLTPGMASGNPLFKELEGSLGKSKSIAGQLTSKEIEKTHKALEVFKDSLFKEARDIDPFEVGSMAKEGLKAKFSDEIMPAKMIYNDLDGILKETPLTESLKKRLITERGKDFAVRVAGDGEKWVDKISKLETIDDAKQFRTMIGQSMRAEKDPFQKKFLSDLYDGVTTLRSNAIKYNLKGRPFVNKEVFRGDVADALDLADTMYAKAHDEYSFLRDQFGIKSRNMDDFIEQFEELSEEEIAKKIMSLKDTTTAKKFQAYSPEVYDIARASYLNEVAKKTLHKGDFSPAKLVSALKNKPKRELEILFPNHKDPKELLRHYETIVNDLPPLTNPSGTAYELALQNILSLGYQGSELLRYAVYKKGSKAFQERLKNSPKINSINDDLVPDAASKAPVLQEVEKASNKGKTSISNAVQGYLEKVNTGVKVGTKGLERYIIGKSLPDKDYKELEDKAAQLNANPEQIIEAFQKRNQQIIKAAPKTSESANATIVRAVQFLAQKAPKVNPSIFDDKKPSRSEVLKFRNYLEAVENPMEAMDMIAKGYVTPEAIEVFQVVYPSIYNEMKNEFAARIPEFKNLSEKQKSDLSRLLGLEDRPAWSSFGFGILQAGNIQQQKISESQQKIPLGAAKNISQDKRNQSSFDLVVNRA
jgi:hypothetical protein